MTLIVRRVSTDWHASIENESTVDQLPTKMSMECRLSVNQGVDGMLMEGRSRVSIEGIDPHLTADAISMISSLR